MSSGYDRLPEPFEPEVSLEHILETKDSFHSCRWRCVTRPGRAQATLGPCSRLEINIIQARNLLSWSPSTSSFQRPGSPYIDGYLDDRKVFHTLVGASAMPVWNHHETVKLTCQTSMVRLMVMDSGESGGGGGNEIGFVEFCVGDLAWNYELEGWLELRFSNKLAGTSTDRFAQHCSQRDEDERGADRNMREEAAWPPAQNARTPRYSTAAATDQVQHNAGEMLVKLTLRRMDDCSMLDTMLALVFDRPPPKRFPAKSDLIANKPLPKSTATATATAKRPAADPARARSNKLHVQNFGDSLSELKMVVLEGGVYSIGYFIKYLIKWRSCLLSAPVLAACVAMYFEPKLGWILWPSFFAIMLLVSISERFRKEVTTGGRNAPFSQEGFESVARWRDTETMKRYLKRIVFTVLQGEVKDQQEFHVCAACCFSNGVPKVTYRQLVNILRNAKFVSAEGVTLEPGDHVLVDSKLRAMVLSVAEESGEVTVRYEEGNRSQEALDASRVVPRLLVPAIPVWALPGGLKNNIISLDHTIGKVSRSLTGVVQTVTDLFTWKALGTSFAVFLALVAFAVAAAMVQFGKWEQPKEVSSAEAGIVDWVHWLMWTIKHHFLVVAEHVWYWGMLVAIVFVLTFWSQWLVGLRTVAKIIWRWLTMPRMAPIHWAFFCRPS